MATMQNATASLQVCETDGSGYLTPNLRRNKTHKRRISFSERVAPDGGFGWTVVMATFVVSLLTSGFSKSFGAFKDFIFTRFPDASPSEGAWISILMGATGLIVSPPIGMMTTVYGFRVMVFAGGALCCASLAASFFATSAGFLAVTLGVALGIGSSCAFTSSVACVGRYFTIKRPTALAIALSGSCAGAVILPFCVKIALHALGLQYTFVVFGCVFSIICICAVAFGPPEKHFVLSESLVESDHVYREDRLSYTYAETNSCCLVEFAYSAAKKMALRFLFDKVFLVTAVSVFFTGLANPHFLGYLTETAGILGVDSEETQMLPIFAAVGDFCGRIFYGITVFYSPFSRSAEYVAATFVSAVVLTVLPFCTSYAQLSVVAVVAGFGTGISTVLVPVLLGQNHGFQSASATYALIRSFQGLAALIHPLVAELVRSAFGFETVVVFTAGATCIASFASVSLHLLFIFRLRQQQLPA